MAARREPGGGPAGASGDGLSAVAGISDAGSRLPLLATAE